MLRSSYNTRQFKDQKVNNVDPEEAAHNEPSDLDLRCLQVKLSFLIICTLILKIRAYWPISIIFLKLEVDDCENLPGAMSTVQTLMRLIISHLIFVCTI